MSSKRYVVFLMMMLLTGANACHKPETEEQALPALSFNVPTVTLTAKKESGYVEITGTVSGDTSVALSTKLMSEIKLLLVEEGDKVKAGQLLARIDDADIQAMRSEAAGYRAEAAAALGEVQAVVAQGEAGKAQAEAAVKQAEAAYADAKRDYERAERLAQEDSIPRAQRDKAELGMQVAAENLNRAKSAVKQAEGAIAQAESKRPQIAAKEQQAAAKDAQAAAMQSYATLTAPFDGVVTKKYFKQGQLSIPGQPLLVIEKVDAFRVQAAAPDNLLSRLNLDQELEVLLDEPAGTQTAYKGKIVVLGSSADPANHTVKLEIKLEPAPGLFSGRFARVRIPGGEKTTLMIPAGAILHEGEINYVWRVSPAGVLAQVPVETGPAEADGVPVVRGLSPGDVIVSQPVPELYAGARVAATGPGSAQ